MKKSFSQSLRRALRGTGDAGRAVEGASPYEGDEGRREGQAPPLRMRRGGRRGKPLPYGGYESPRRTHSVTGAPTAPVYALGHLPRRGRQDTPLTPPPEVEARYAADASPRGGGKAAPVCKGNRRAAKGCPCGGRRTGCRGASPYEGDEGRQKGQASPLRGDVRLLRRGRRPRRPVARRRARVGGRFINRPYGKQGIRIATATPPSPTPPPPQCAHWGTPKTPGGGGKLRRRHFPFQGRQGGAGLQGQQAGGQRLPLWGTKDGLSRAPAPTQRIPPFP